MQSPAYILRLKQAFMAVVVLGVIAAFIIPPLMATDYSVKQGEFRVEVLTSASGMGMAARPILRAQVKDETGRTFWVGVPASITVAPGTDLVINVWCETEAFDNCIGRYRRLAPPAREDAKT